MEGLGIFIWPGINNFLYTFKMEEDMKEAMCVINNMDMEN